MSQMTTLGEALGEIVDEVMRTHGIEKEKHPVVRQVLYQVAACTASLMVKHYNREQLEHEEKDLMPLYRAKGSNNVH